MNEKILEREPKENETEKAPKNNCTNCRFSEYVNSFGVDGMPLVGEQQLVCMHSPPVCFLINFPTEQGMASGIRTQFPPVSKTMYCHQYERKQKTN